MIDKGEHGPMMTDAGRIVWLLERIATALERANQRPPDVTGPQGQHTNTVSPAGAGGHTEVHPGIIMGSGGTASMGQHFREAELERQVKSLQAEVTKLAGSANVNAAFFMKEQARADITMRLLKEAREHILMLLVDAAASSRRAIKEDASAFLEMIRDTRPGNCRFRLADDGKPYPKSSCQACGRSIATGLGKECHHPVVAGDEGTLRLADERKEPDEDDRGGPTA